MDPIVFKAFCGFTILATAILGGLLPLLGVRKPALSCVMEYGEFFARGVFLGAALIHLLPEAWSHFQLAYPNIRYPVIGALCAVTIFLVQFIEQSAMRFFQGDKFSPAHCISYLLFLLLSIHAIIEGAALGISDTIPGAATLFIAIIAHKSSSAFALAMNMVKTKVSTTRIWIFILLFSLMTPLGVLCGSGMLAYLEGSAGQLMQALFNAVAAGTFFYIAFFEHADSIEHHLQEQSSSMTILSFGVGILVMAIVGIWT